MSHPSARAPRLLALSDLHVAYPENRKLIEEFRPESEIDVTERRLAVRDPRTAD